MSATFIRKLRLTELDTQPRNAMDDEYVRAGEIDPRVMITTSRDPSSRLVQFAKEMTHIFPNSQRINRGSYTTNDVVDACRKNDVTDLVLVHEHRGEPDVSAYPCATRTTRPTHPHSEIPHTPCAIQSGSSSAHQRPKKPLRNPRL